MPQGPLLKDMFVYPVERYIPPVAKVDEVAEKTIATELGEYLVTAPIERALVNFLEVCAESRTAPTDRIGVWISGFFGSGKSPFAKVLSYLLTNPTVAGWHPGSARSPVVRPHSTGEWCCGLGPSDDPSAPLSVRLLSRSVAWRRSSGSVQPTMTPSTRNTSIRRR